MKRAEAQELRHLLIGRVKELDAAGDACLALSGGMDSMAVLFAMLDAGRKPRCYTFYMDGHPSRDLVIAQHVTKTFGLEHVAISLPTDHETIIKDCREAIEWSLANKTKKIIVECLRPWFYLCPEMKARGDMNVMTGFSSDEFMCLGAKEQKLWRKLGEDEFRRLYRRHYFDINSETLQFSNANIRSMCDRRYGIAINDPFADDGVCAWFNQFPLDYLHRSEDARRLEKAPLIYAFEDYVRRTGTPGEKGSYQKVSGLADFHEGLLWNEQYNPGGKHQAVIGIYNDLAAGRL